jgi:polyadenylation factor subunit 2
MSQYVDSSQFVNPREQRPRDVPQQQQQGGRRYQPDSGVVFDGKRIRAAIVRKPIDYTHSITTELEERIYQPMQQTQFYCPPHLNFQHKLYPPSTTHNHSWDILTHFAHASTNKNRTQINSVSWTPEGRRLISGSAQGEFTLWNGMAFNFETIQQAHDEAVRSIVWTHNGNFMVSCDNKGEIKYWQSNMNNLKAFKGHDMMIRDLSFSPTDKKFVSCSDDASMKIWDFDTYQSERTLHGHGSDVRCCDWHPFNSLIVSGGKDSLVKIFDAKSEREIATLYGHKQIVNRVKWNRNGNWILTCAKDQLIKVFDIRFMKEASYTFRGHKKDVSSIAWHPSHERLFASGGYEG